MALGDNCMIKNQLQVATVFSGIGAFEQSLKKLHIPFSIAFACDNGERMIKGTKEEIIEHCKNNNFNDEEILEYVKLLYQATHKENFMKKAYFANYDIKEEQWYEDIRFIDGNKYKGKVDILVGGSPCQSFSIIGKKAGLNDTRGTLFYDYARLVSEMQPAVFIYENVPGMLAHDHGNTWKVIKDVFDSLGYDINFNILNAKDFGIPQDRKRLFVVGFKNKDIQFRFPLPLMLNTTMFDYLEEEVDAKFYLGQKGFEFVTNPKYKNRARVNHKVIQTEKANQQFNWNGDFVFVPLEKIKDNKEIMARAYISEYEGKKGAIRQLTHRECMRLMGFPDDFKIVVPNVWAYRHAGNSIVVNVLENIMRSVLETGVFDENN